LWDFFYFRQPLHRKRSPSPHREENFQGRAFLNSIFAPCEGSCPKDWGVIYNLLTLYYKSLYYKQPKFHWARSCRETDTLGHLDVTGPTPCYISVGFFFYHHSELCKQFTIDKLDILTLYYKSLYSFSVANLNILCRETYFRTSHFGFDPIAILAWGFSFIKYTPPLSQFQSPLSQSIGSHFLASLHRLDLSLDN